MPSIEGIGIQGGSLLLMLYVWDVSVWDTHSAPSFLWGVLPPFIVIPPLEFKGTPVVPFESFRQLWIKWSALLHWKHLHSFSWYRLTAFTNQAMYYSLGSSSPVSCSPVSSMPEQSISWVTSPTSQLSSPSMAAALVKTTGWFPFSLHEGNKLLGVVAHKLLDASDWECCDVGVSGLGLFHDLPCRFKQFSESSWLLIFHLVS